MSIKDMIFGKHVAQNGKPTKGKQKLNSVNQWIPIEEIRDGVIITPDGRFVKIIEVLPVNFYLKSDTEQQNIIFYFTSYLKIAPDHLQMVSITQKANIDAYINRLW